MRLFDLMFGVLLAALAVLMVAAFMLISVPTKAAAESRHTELMVSNPYFLSIQSELKCDWDGKRYAHHQDIIIKKRSKTVIMVPHGLRKCELWSKIRW